MNERETIIFTHQSHKFLTQILALAGLLFLCGGTPGAANPGLRLHGDINSAFQELSPVISNDGKFLFFCREGDPQNAGFKQRRHDQDIWMSSRQSDGSFGPPEHLDAPFNTVGYDFPIAFFAENQTLYIGNAYSADGKSAPGISKSRLEDGKFSFPEALIIEDFYNDVNLVSYGMGADQKTLVMSLRRKDTHGKSDLYVSFLQESGKWTKPKNLGDDINSADSELAPYLADDLRTLYFASNRSGGFGKFDIYVSRREDDSYTKWTAPINLGSGFNTTGSDITIALTPDGSEAIYATDSASGGKDLRIKPLPEKFRPIKSVVIRGSVIDVDGKPLEARIFAEKLGTEKILNQTKSSLPGGEFTLTLPPGMNYGLHAEKENYAPVSVSVDLRKDSGIKPREIRLTLVPLQAGSKITLHNVFFASNSAQLSKISHSELNRLVLLMKANLSLKIEIGGHTDNVGSPGSNMKLSGRRAAAVRSYLLSRGIDKSRISARGYGATKPVAKNSSEKGRRLNRRVEFSILEF